MAHRARNTSTIATNRSRIIQLLQKWAWNNAYECLDCGTRNEAVLDIRLGQRLQVFLIAPKREHRVVILVIGTLHGYMTEYRHGCPACLLTWLAEGTNQPLPQAHFNPRLNSLVLGLDIPLANWPAIETFCLPQIKGASSYVARLVACLMETNGLDSLEQSSADLLRERFLAEVSTCIPLLQQATLGDLSPISLH